MKTRYYLRLVPCLLILLLSLIPRVEAQQKCEGDLLITINSSGCFGDCPAYSARIYADGTVVYVGVSNVKEIGERRHKISPGAMQALIKEFQRLDYWSLKDSYEADEQGRRTTDQQITTTSICLDGKKKQVVNIYGPKRLDELEERIDSLAGLYSLLGPL
jgi:hypothetical protein